MSSTYVTLNREALSFPTTKYVKADLAIYKPWKEDGEEDRIFTIAEIKRTYERSSNVNEVLQDIARLSILASVYRVTTYLFLCGRPQNTKKLLGHGKLVGTLSDDSDNEERSFDAKKLLPDMDADYNNALTVRGVNEISTRLVQPFVQTEYSSYVWRIQTGKDQLIRDELKFYVNAPDGER